MKKEKLCVAYDVDRYYFDADLCSKAIGEWVHFGPDTFELTADKGGQANDI